MGDLEISQRYQVEEEYKIALYKAATRAADLVAGALAPDKVTSMAHETPKLNTALSLLAIVQGGQLPKHESK